MSRRALLAAAAGLSAAATAPLQGRSPRRPPNILFIVVDDLNGWVQCLGGHPQIRTPAIDRLARRGTLFRKAYCPAPYCNASRMAVFTGCLPSTTGIYRDQEYWGQPQRRPTYLEALRRHGYQLFAAGKVLHGRYRYGAAGPADQDRVAWIDDQNRAFLWNQSVPPAPDYIPEQPQRGRDQFAWGMLPPQEERQQPDVITADAAIAFLQQPGPEPFFCAAGLYRPHLPWFVPQRFLDLYPLEQIQLPPVLASDLTDLPAAAKALVGASLDRQRLLDLGQTRQAVQAYMASVSFADAQVNRILEGLAASPARHNTVVALWSDNGFHLGEKLHWRKFTLWEEATHVPLIVVPPEGDRVAAAVDQPVSVLDLFPTLFDLCGLPPLQPVDGRSLVPWMQGKAGVESAAAVMTWGEGNHSLRQGNWRYTRYRDGGEELYNQSSDPHEWHNLAADDRYGPVKRQLRQMLEQRLASAQRP
jgi:arylsulfatase A-like enzyme